MGWKDVGCHGSDIKTPNIDKLATEGARLDDSFPVSRVTAAAWRPA
ncbi:hypothetical protein [Rhizobium sp. R693]|nr:hypothetical protein [Rhizobium sp. R693]